jgi:hypothetical protein
VSPSDEGDTTNSENYCMGNDGEDTSDDGSDGNDRCNDDSDGSDDQSPMRPSIS